MSEQIWISVCGVEDLVDNSGVCALVNGEQVALFKLQEGDDAKVFAISNWDPIGKANVLYRGLLASSKERIVVASPLYKQRYCLSSGACLDDDTARVSVYPARIVDQIVELGVAG